MAEFLIKKVDATNPDPTKNERSCYKAGDIVQVWPDGSFVEPPSPNGKMWMVKAPNISYELVKKYMESHEVDEIYRGGTKKVMRWRRDYRLDFTKLKQNQLSQLQSTRVLEISKASELRSAVYRKSIGAYEG